MIYSDTTTNSGILQEVESLVFASEYGTITGSTNNLQTFTRYANQALDKVVTKILESDNRWQYDDSTYTDFPVATTTLVANQKDYSLSVSHLKILGISVLDNSGLWTKLQPIDPQDWKYQDRDEYFKVPATPAFYDVMANSVFLYPAPAAANVTLTNGLKVYFQREPNYFLTTDTTKKPGFPSIFHRLVALWTAYYYYQANSVPKANMITDEIKKMESEMTNYYSRRQVDQKSRFVPARVLSR